MKMYQNIPDECAKSRFDSEASNGSGHNYDRGSSSRGKVTKPHGAKSVCHDPESVDMPVKRCPIAVIGSGEFGHAISMKIAQSGYAVYIGSRNPEKCQ